MAKPALSWWVSVQVYAQTGAWCQTALLVYGPQLPADLIAAGLAERVKWLREQEREQEQENTP